MRGINKVILLANVCSEIEVRYFPDGTAVANFRVATSSIYKDKNTGEQKESSEFHRITVTGKLAEICGEYLKKGSPVYLEGSLHTRKWQDKQSGQDRYSTEVRVYKVEFLGDRGDPKGNDAPDFDDDFPL